MLKKHAIIIILCLSGFNIHAETEDKKSRDNTDIIPVIKYEKLKFDKQELNNYCSGLIIMKNNSGAESTDSADHSTKNAGERDSLFTALLLSRTNLEKEPLYEYPDNFTNIEFILQKKKNKQQYFTLFKSCSDKPVSGGLNTYQFLSGYGYEIISTDRHSLYIGGSAAVYDWGIEMENGEPWPVLPLPFIHYEFSAPYLFSAFDFTSSPMLDLVIAPESRLRLNSSFLISDAAEWDKCGIKCDINLEYRFFSADHESGDFAGIRGGFIAEDYTADLSDENNTPIQVGWKTVYAALDLSFLEIIYGYGSGKTWYEESVEQDCGNGFYMSIQAAWMF